jgi:hypothetical protein
VKTQEEKDVVVIGILRLYLVIAKLKYYATPVLACLAIMQFQPIYITK